MTEAGNDAESRYRPVIYQLLQVSNLMLKTREHYAATAGVTAPQFSVMTAINEAPGTSIGDVAARLMVTGPFVTTEIGKLIKAGLVRKQASARDRRVTELFLTVEGTARLHAAAPLRIAANDTIFSDMSERELQQLSIRLLSLIDGLNKALHTMDGPDMSARDTGRF